MEITGGCQCGRVRFRAEAESLEGYYCHCRMCQRALGNIFAAWLNVAKKAVIWEAAPPDLYHSSKIAERGFCRQCGTPLSFAFPDSDRIDLAVGALDHPELTRPKHHFAVERRIANWHVPDGLPDHKLSDYQALVDRWIKAEGKVPE